MAPAFQAEFKYTHLYNVAELRHRGSRRDSPKGLHVSSGHRGLRTLPGFGRTFARSPGLLPSGCPRAPPPAPILPDTGRLLLGLRARLPGSQAWVSGRSARRARARGAPHSGAARTALPHPPSPAQEGGGRSGAGRAEPPGPSPPPPSPKLPTPLGPDGLMIRRILLGRPGRGAGSGAERRGQQAGAASRARAGSGAEIEAAAAAPRARRTFSSGQGNRCMGPGGRPCCAERRRRRTPQAGWG
jgi:hypothetical protein